MLRAWKLRTPSQVVVPSRSRSSMVYASGSHFISQYFFVLAIRPPLTCREAEAVARRRMIPRRSASPADDDLGAQLARLVRHAGQVVEVDAVLHHLLVEQVARECGHFIAPAREGVADAHADVERVAVELLRLVEEEALLAVVGP